MLSIAPTTNIVALNGAAELVLAVQQSGAFEIDEGESSEQMQRLWLEGSSEADQRTDKLAAWLDRFPSSCYQGRAVRVLLAEHRRLGGDSAPAEDEWSSCPIPVVELTAGDIGYAHALVRALDGWLSSQRPAELTSRRKALVKRRVHGFGKGMADIIDGKRMSAYPTRNAQLASQDEFYGVVYARVLERHVTLYGDECTPGFATFLLAVVRTILPREE